MTRAYIIRQFPTLLGGGITTFDNFYIIIPVDRVQSTLSLSNKATSWLACKYIAEVSYLLSFQGAKVLLTVLVRVDY